MRALMWLALSLIACSSPESNENDTGSGGSGAGGASGKGSSGGSGGNVSSGGGAGKGGSAGSVENVTWAEHIAPLVYRECIACHREGGVGPFSLTDYELASALSIGLATMTAARLMPPMPVDNSGSCNTFSNARWLSDAEIALFEAWADAGAPEGDPSLTPELPPPPDGLTGPITTVGMSEPYTPSRVRPDDYRCFLVDPGLSAGQFLVAYEVVPGDRREVHHVIAYAPDDAAAEAEAVALDNAEAGPGYTCFGGSGVDAEPRVLWAPGVDVVTLPAGTGLPLMAGRKLILQIHYHVGAGAFPDQTSMRLRTAPSVRKAARYQPVADPDMRIAPGLPLGTTTRVYEAEGKPGIIYGALPHMHTLGRTLKVEMNLGPSPTCLVNVDRWDFHWQNAWWYTTPIAVSALNSLGITCGYDTTSRTTPVTWGEGTEDEMCISYLYVTGP